MTIPTPLAEPAAPNEIAVWDLLVRLAHWSVVIAFAIAYLSEDDALTLHTVAGYAIALIVSLRVIWGFIGSPHARFSDFVKRPAEVIAYLRSVPSGTGKRFIGHNPAGGAMAVALLLGLAATTLSGMATLAEQKHQGPLAPFYSVSAPATAGVSIIAPARADDDGDARRGGEHRKKSAAKEVHEFFANAMLVLIALHLTGVVLSSRGHHENLIRAMITGRKRP
ncbi:cytochrome b/b6 domain-containing protein [Rhodospirillum rubrum]|uniref:Cytochrome B561 n=1 Tax=Rhodospirillum rubrum (strain ATCC 11170 / ATH 1.1.1 / DSM 467 / LMG 4362 / NCIMB 8255 / S1) TaxID=269796 RepID=Q2RV01_RHORT|nr:cytochrome b/b6 domain-containing protein [Rhodospirillum rubrum]ABC22044.1 Cytochrome B561 [Rhodospirillum rubrum ATCC 11170]AEO47756.1 cytochrome B561 [Rhodospirillum rubrum F11]MBK5953627.1 cytochrome b [Rhodospirillum rubrum]QXG81697.1 cytochrome b/b6 domain-containing protein [Rhodospirillum rubrum]HAQ00224.1 cytochrome B [Rhodospirillum rubrum]